MNVVELEISGNDKQKITEQNDNLLIFKNGEQEINGVTVSFENGVITLNGTAINMINLDIPIKDLLKADTYRCTISQISGSRSDNVGFLLRDSNTDENLITINGSGGTTYVLENNTYCYLRIYIPKNNQISNLVYKCMLSKGEEAKAWVEGIPNSPSPEYPSEIETVNTQANIIICNKNFFDKDTMKLTSAFLNYDTTAKEDFKLITAGSEDYICYIVPLPKHIRNFTISAETFGNRGVGCGFVEYPKLNMEADQFFFSNSNYKGGSYTANEDINYVMLFVCNDGVEPVNLMIEEGNTATEYVPFMLQTKVVDIQQEMLEGDYFVKEEDGWKEVHGWNKKLMYEIKDWNNTYGIHLFACTAFSGIDKTVKSGISNYFKFNNVESGIGAVLKNGEFAIQNHTGSAFFKNEDYDNVTDWISWLRQKHEEGNPIYVWYKLATPTKLACTEKQVQQLEDLLNTSTYKNVTHIYSTDKVSPIIKVVYRKDIETMFNTQQSNYDTRLSNIEKLLSTTTTSALLLDNLQSDLEKEVL